MTLTLASISPRAQSAKNKAAEALVLDYVARAARMLPTTTVIYPTEAALLQSLDRQPGRPAATLILFDSRGANLTSEAFARSLGQLRDRSTPRLVFAIGPADGWSAAARAQAAQVVSFGAITMPHELARAVAAEQIYRALTILAGHPYHSGHESLQ